MLDTLINEINNRDSEEEDNKLNEPVNWDSDEDVEDQETDPEVKLVLEAAENGRTEQLAKLLQDKPHLANCRDIDLYTPLHRACYNGHVETIDFLLRKGADIHARTSEGWTPLHSASKWSHHQAASLLLSAGADVNALTNGGVTPLHLAASHNNRPLLELLLFRPETNVKIRNDSGETAYEIAKRHSPWYRLFHLGFQSQEDEET